MIIHFEKLSRALDIYNANRIESEKMEFSDIVGGLNNRLDSEEVLETIVDLLLDTH